MVYSVRLAVTVTVYFEVDSTESVWYTFSGFTHTTLLNFEVDSTESVWYKDMMRS